MSVPPPPPPPGFSISYYGFEPCCGGPIVYFRFDGTTDAPNEGINIYNGPAAIGYNPITDSYVPLENNQCYKVFRGEATNPASPIDGTNYGNLQVVPTAFGTNYIWDATSNYETPCGDEEPGFCPSCETQCYDLWPCDGALVAVTTDTDLSAYLNTFASIQVNADFGFSCYYVTLSTSCINSVTVVVDGDTPCVPCDCTCYEIIGTAKLSYVDCDGNPIQTFVNGYWKGCTLTYPITDPAPGPNLVVTSHGDCVDGQCPGQCYELVDCEGLLDPIYTTAQSLSPYATLGQTVVIQGYTNCWTVNTSLTCDCAIDVVVVQVYADCATCNPAPNYILSNCDDLNTVIYTSTDLSDYVGEVLEISPDCPGCWLVEQVNGPIPSDVPITVITSFTDCEACKTTYYRLADCLEIQSDIVTFTDLSQYVGQVIKLEWCPDVCWQVSVSQTSANAGLLGDIVNEFNTCQDCIDTFTCVCKRIKNHDNVAHNYDYLDCEGIVQTITLLSGERSERICMKLLLTSFATDYVETFGNCTLDEDVYTCPPQIYPKRTVRPGYSTPICSTEKYEKITCKSAEILYKQVLNLRYGITNCCPEEDDKWLLKKQIIDLQALVDPNYICMPSTCGCPSSSCGCGSTNSCNCH